MNCRKVNHYLSAYMDGELPGVEHRQMHEHLARCTDCAAEYSGLLRMKRLLAGLRVQEPDVELPARILERVRRESGGRETHRVAGGVNALADWLRSNAPMPQYLMVGASLAVVGILFTVHFVDSGSEKIQWHPENAASIATLQPAPDLQRTSATATLPYTYRSVGVSQVSPSPEDGFQSPSPYWYSHQQTRRFANEFSAGN